MSDIHGEYELFIRMLDKIDFRDTDKLIILGDVIDRGNRPIDILLYIMGKNNIELLKGNHEQMMLEYIKERDVHYKNINLKIWLNNGAESTINQYNKLSKNKKIKILNYIDKLELYKIVGDIILVHSGINLTGLKDKNLDEIMEIQTTEDILWTRDEFYKNKGLDGYKIIFGHTPTPNIRVDLGCEEIDFSIWYDDKYKDKIAIDCGVISSKGYLGCLRLDDYKEYYVARGE